MCRHFIPTNTRVPAVWRRIQWRGLPPRSPTWPRRSWPRSLWWSHWAELTASRLTHVSRRGTNHKRQLMSITPCNTSARWAPLSSHTLFLLPPLIPALMNKTWISRRSSREGETPSASASELHTRPSLPFLLSPPHISLKCDSWRCVSSVTQPTDSNTRPRGKPLCFGIRHCVFRDG